MKKLVYVSGGMSGIPLQNKPMFDKAEDYLRRKGYMVITPAAKPNEILDRTATEKEYLAFMREDIYAILYKNGGVNEIWTLPNWRNSRGAKFEVLVGKFFNIPIKHLTKGQLYESKQRTRTT